MRALVTGRVAATLGVQLLRADAWADRNRAVPPQALDLLSRARAELRWSGKGAQATAQVRGLLEEAVREHEPFGEAWALLANSYLNDVRFSPTREDDLRRASTAAQRAVALQPDSDWVRFVEGRLQYEQRHMAQALAAFERAAQLNPNNVSALGYRGAALVMLGRPDEALLQIEQAIRLSPRDPQLPAWEMFAGVAHLHLGHDAQAVEWLERSVRAYPSSPFGRLFLAGALGAAGRIPEAQAQMAQLQQLRPGFTLGRFRSVEPSDAVAFRAQRERLYEGLRRAGMPD
jgi:tetratricopeptide (TPR) repeat protein